MESAPGNCSFCGEEAVATITTPGDVLTFLCSQLRMEVILAQMFNGVCLCSSCHYSWEEVSLIYANMEGLVNLMGRRVEQIKKAMIARQGQETELGGRPASSEPIGNPEPGQSSSIIGWWYGPSTSTQNMADDQADPPSDSIDICEGESIQIKTEFEEEAVDMSQFLQNEEEQNHLHLQNHGQPQDFHQLPIIPRRRRQRRQVLPQAQKRIQPVQDLGQVENQGLVHPRPRNRVKKEVCSTSSRTKPQSSALDESTNFEVIPTSRGNAKLVASGHTYYYVRNGPGKKIWRCKLVVNGKRLCGARLHTTEDTTQILTFVGSHNHPPGQNQLFFTPSTSTN